MNNPEFPDPPVPRSGYLPTKFSEEPEFEQKVRALPLSDAEQEDILALRKSTRRFPWFRVIVYLVFATLPLLIGWDGMMFILHEKPAETAEHVSALWAFASARQVGFFFVGAWWILLSIVTTMSWWHARLNFALVQKLVALVPAPEQNGSSGPRQS